MVVSPYVRCRRCGIRWSEHSYRQVEDHSWVQPVARVQLQGHTEDDAVSCAP
jgi:hypothetical protein